MKKTLLFTLLTLFGLTQAMAQEYEYVPFVREGVKWVYRIYNDGGFYPTDPSVPEGRTYMKLEFKGDTTINGKIYKAMHKYHGDTINREHDTIPIYMREENKPDGCYQYYQCSQNQLELYFRRFGAEAEIISPESLREKMAEFYRLALRAYNG